MFLLAAHHSMDDLESQEETLLVSESLWKLQQFHVLWIVTLTRICRGRVSSAVCKMMVSRITKKQMCKHKNRLTSHIITP